MKVFPIAMSANQEIGEGRAPVGGGVMSDEMI